eukprot:gene16923-20130_t
MGNSPSKKEKQPAPSTHHPKKKPDGGSDGRAQSTVVTVESASYNTGASNNTTTGTSNSSNTSATATSHNTTGNNTKTSNTPSTNAPKHTEKDSGNDKNKKLDDFFDKYKGYYKQATWFTRSHIIDWVTCIVVFLLEQVITNFAIHPFDRFEPSGFQLVEYPLLKDIVPTWLLMLVVFVLPLAVFFGFYLYYRNLHDFHHAFLGLFETFTITMIFTDFLKVIAGRYRPDYAARVASGASAAIIRDGRMSFPSGHSSLSFAAMTYLSLYICGKLKVFRKEGAAMWKILIAMLPYAICSLIAVSRTRDYHHDFGDIIAGSCIGLAIGNFIYFANFNTLSSKESALPKNRLNPSYAKDGLLFADKEDIYTSLSIQRIKERVEEKEGIPPSQQRLIFGGKQMGDEKTAQDYSIEGGSVLHLVLALRGGL